MDIGWENCMSLICFVCFCSYRKRGQLMEPPEMASLQVVRHRISQMRQSKNMKEKLIRAAEGLQVSSVTCPHE